MGDADDRHVVARVTDPRAALTRSLRAASFLHVGFMCCGGRGAPTARTCCDAGLVPLAVTSWHYHTLIIACHLLFICCFMCIFCVFDY